MTDTTNAANSSPITAECAANSLMPCPFCGWAEIDPTEWSTKDGITGPACPKCNAMADSVEAWNRRAAPQPQGGALTDEQILAIWREWSSPMGLCRDIIGFARATLSQSAPSAPQQAGDGLTEKLLHGCNAVVGATHCRPAHETGQLKEIARSLEGWAINAQSSAMKMDLKGHASAIRAILAAPRQPGEMGAGVQYKDSTPQLHVGDSSFEEWFSAYNPAEKGDKQRARDAYAAGMGDPLVTAASAQQDEREALGESNRLQFLMDRYPGTVEFKRSTVLAIMRQFGEALLAQQVQADAGAVPFGYAQPSGSNYFTRTKHIADRIGGLVPVYTHPSPAGESDKRDAQRFRWMIEHIHTHRLWERKGSWFCLPNNATEGRGYSTASDAIDAAMSREQSQEKGGE